VPAIHPTAVVEADSIGPGVTIGEFAVVRADAVIGEGASIHPHVVIGSGVEIGAGVHVLPGSFLGREPRAVGTISRRPSFRRRLSIGDGCAVGAAAVVYYDVEVGAESLIGDGASIREGCRVGSRTVVGRGVTLDCDVVLGEGSKAMDKAHLTGGMVVGEGVFISAMVVSTNDNSFGLAGGALRAPVIESAAMIGAGASLLPGVVVGRSAIVGSGAVVTADVAPGTTVMGIPARPVEPR
jgi:acetyltransferase-like isoleucine patch superfamily enzyme